MIATLGRKATPQLWNRILILSIRGKHRIRILCYRRTIPEKMYLRYFDEPAGGSL